MSNTSAFLSFSGLCAAILAFALVPVGPAKAATHIVTNCNDSGPGSLRDAVAGAANLDDIVDMTALSCNKILLTNGAIIVEQDDLTLVGPSADLLAIDGNGTDRVFLHSPTARAGILRLRRLSVTNGRVVETDAFGPDPYGGCIYSPAVVILRAVDVKGCSVSASLTRAYGGGVYARRSLKLLNSRLVGNSAIWTGPGGDTSTRAYGGGGYTAGRLYISHSRFHHNHSDGDGGGAYADELDARYADFRGNVAIENGGGLVVWGYSNAMLLHSVIADNHAGQDAGGADIGYARNILIANSTISGNVANEIGGLRVMGGDGAGGATTSIVNSTIAFNRSTADYLCSGALEFSGEQIELESTIAAMNICAGEPTPSRQRDVHCSYYFGGEVVGGNNLIGASNTLVPPDTISTDPRLAPLANNGGGTQTHALLDDSPAINAGNNVAGLDYDQRGSGYPRVKGPQADIGAYER